MSTFTFPYEKKIIEEGEISDPRVSLRLETPYGQQNIKFLVDSGADVTTLPIEPYGRLFNFKVDPDVSIIIGGIEGRGIRAYPYRLTVNLGSERIFLRSYFVESLVDPLLGRLDFWNLFSINFDNQKKRTVFQKL